MPRKRRKLNPEMEKDISAAKRKVELISAIINDIHDEEIQGEYRTAFDKVKYAYTYLSTLYDAEGFTEVSNAAFTTYNELLVNFESEFEI